MKTRLDALSIFRAALEAAQPEPAVRTALRRLVREGLGGRVWIAGAGKAAAHMARAAEAVLCDAVAGGLAAVKDAPPFQLRRVEARVTGHPVPDARGVRAAAEMAQLLRAAGKRDTVLALISGGASALLPAPAPGITLAAKRRITEQLLARGATIQEMNTVRKHLSYLKGGQMAQLAAPAQVVALILSDVVGDPLEIIGSGPTVADPSTSGEARAIAKRYRVALPPRLRETPKTLANVTNQIVGSNRIALMAAAREARRLGYRVMALSPRITGETRDVALVHAAIAREASPGTCLLSGGETTVTLRGKGKGGRNQEFVLAAAMALADRPDILVFSAGTDGSDGPTEAAGAAAGGVYPDARGYLDNNDSYSYFKKYGGLVLTGPTGTNVMDVHVFLVPGRA